MYFDERPKTRLEDFFNREKELQLFRESITRGSPLILLVGLRRAGKTSLLYTGLNTLNVRSILLDMRRFEERPAISRVEFLEALSDAISAIIDRTRGLRDYLKKVRGVEVMGARIEFEWSKKKRLSITSLLEKLDEWANSSGERIVVAFDEAQILSKLRGINLLPILAYCYDRLRNITIILTGSEVGLLHRFLRLEEPRAPLYGRHYTEVRLENLDYERSMEFLRIGFAQLGIKPPVDVLQYAVERLDGVLGWLTEFGLTAKQYGCTHKAVDATLERGAALALHEFENFLSIRGIAARRYRMAAELMAQTTVNWMKIKRYLQAMEGRTVSDNTLHNIINSLANSGFIRRVDDGYEIADPVLRYALLARHHKQA
ncbi:MAG: ATP-binding protein [Aigarchaeota archaeon]|nr:ATP-binding protein [Candidatus Pelearchaeum maunauluense]